MSLPLTRRIAKTVLLTAAGAASVVGTAGAASAAELPSTADVGGLSKLDNGLSDQVGDTASKGAKALTPMSSTSPLAAPAPDAEVTARTNNGGVVPDSQRLAANTVSGAGNGMEQSPQLERHLPDVRTKGLPTDNAPQTMPGQAPVQNPAAQAPAQAPAPQDLITQTARNLGISPQSLPTKGLNVGPLGR